MCRFIILNMNFPKKLLSVKCVYKRVFHLELLFFISFRDLKIVCGIKKKKFSQNLHDVKKYLKVPTAVLLIFK